MPKFYDLVGQKFGRLKVTKFHGIRNEDRMWECACTCGNSSQVASFNLISGNTKSCGCLRKDKLSLQHTRMTKHGHMIGHKPSPTYTSWLGAKQRCNNRKNPDYPMYGGRGVRVLFRSVIELVADIGERLPGTSLDRYPNPSGNYEKGNVRWATPKQQANNKRKK